jgi:secreted trypsin-like serine protease
VAACSAHDSNEAPGSNTSDIQNGFVDNGDPAVGLLIGNGGNYFCTGTLIAPDVVLTAGHCVNEARFTEFYLGTGSPNTAPWLDMQRHEVIDQAGHPSYHPLNAPTDCPDSGFDIGLVHLAVPLQGTTPLNYTTSVAPAGAQCKTVGFGVHSNTVGQKRDATVSVTSVGATYYGVVEVTGIPDHGDSGGPLFCASQIVGTTSCGRDESPTHTTGYFSRIDGAAPWITSTIQTWHSTNHSACVPGMALPFSANRCTAQVCLYDASCCTTFWAPSCVSKAQLMCGGCF